MTGASVNDTSDCTALFGFDELFYSRTDLRGVIQAGNDVFQRISGYSWEKLIGAPHRLLRNPDMPKGFFHLFWTRLKAGQPIVGYVKNRTEDGRSYWVLAAATPCEGGYLSVRMRPSSAAFDQVRTLYTRLRERELAGNLSPDAAMQAMLAEISDLGYPSYDAFAAQALALELRARNDQMRRPPDAETELLERLLGLLSETLAEQARLVAMFQDLVLLPVNMRLVAARLEPQGGPISQISVNYKMASEEIARRLSDFVSGKNNICAEMAEEVRRSLVLTGCARLQGELVDLYAASTTVREGEDKRVETAALAAVRDSAVDRVQASLREASRLASGLTAASLDLRRMILGLDTIRILARVESRKSGDSQAALTATIDRIDEVQASISVSLKKLMDRTAAIDADLSALLHGGRAVSGAIAAE